ncbi:hypothetical protein K1719_037326 [Acacia pycnantha]|nr:hypothetical protein K1719_037326 [Acacia pycnantha]
MKGCIHIMDGDNVEVFCGYGSHVVPVDYNLCPYDKPNDDPYFTMKFIREKRYYEVPQWLIGIGAILVSRLHAGSIMRRNYRKNHKILNMIVYIWVYTYYHDVDNDDYYNQTVEASTEEHEPNNVLLTASESSIEGLQRVELEQVQGLGNCVIFLREFNVICLREFKQLSPIYRDYEIEEENEQLSHLKNTAIATLENSPKDGEAPTIAIVEKPWASRSLKRPSWMKDYVSGDGLYDNDSVAHLALFADSDPLTFEEVDKERKWHIAIDEEIKHIEKNNTWELVELLKGKNVVENILNR